MNYNIIYKLERMLLKQLEVKEKQKMMLNQYQKKMIKYNYINELDKLFYEVYLCKKDLK